MITVSVHEAKSRLSAILAEVERTGQTVVVCRHGTPVADICPHRQGQRTTPHPVMRAIKINYEPTEDLDENEWPSSAR